MNYYVGMQEYVDKVSEIVSDGLTLTKEAREMFEGTKACLSRHLKAQGYCKEYADSFIEENVGISSIDFEDVAKDFSDFWKGIENDVVDQEIKVILTEPKANEGSGVKEVFDSITVASLKSKSDDFLCSYTKKTADFYAKVAQLGDMAEEYALPNVGASYWELADIITDNLTVNVLCVSGGIDSSLAMLDFTSDLESEKQDEE